jgi:hypothetical protein
LYIASADTKSDAKAVQAGWPRMPKAIDATPITGSSGMYDFRSANVATEGGNIQYRRQYCCCDHCLVGEETKCKFKSYTDGVPRPTTIVEVKKDPSKTRKTIIQKVVAAYKEGDIVAIKRGDRDDRSIENRIPFHLAELRTNPYKCESAMSLFGLKLRKGDHATDVRFLK